MRRTYGDWDFAGGSILRVRIHPGDTFYGTPEEGQVMYHMGLHGLYVWTGDRWAACSTGAMRLDDLTDVDTTSQPISAGMTLTYDGSQFYPAYPLLAKLSDVDITGATDGQMLVRKSGKWTPVTPKVRISAWVEGRPFGGEVVMRSLIVDNFTIPAGAAGSRVRSGNTAQATAVFTLDKNGASFGSVTFAAGASTGVVAVASATPFSAGDVLSIIAPATQDVTLADIAITLTND